MTSKEKHFYSVIIPMFNEQKTIGPCLCSLSKQTVASNMEIIVVDDGSNDMSVNVVLDFIEKNNIRLTKLNVLLIRTDHSGPGLARNAGSKVAKGKILVFVDADMIFEREFIEKLTKPIKNDGVVGTDSQSEFLLNKNNYWAKCWNMGRFAASRNYSNEYLTNMVPNKKNYGGIFRAIDAKTFRNVGGFESSGDYTDDESLSKRIGVKARIVNSAVFYHSNPDSIKEVITRAYWIGSSSKLVLTSSLTIKNIIKFFPLVSVFKGIIIGLRYKYLPFIFFKIIYDAVVWIAILRKI